MCVRVSGAYAGAGAAVLKVSACLPLPLPPLFWPRTSHTHAAVHSRRYHYYESSPLTHSRTLQVNNYLKFLMQLYFRPTTAKMLSNLKVRVRGDAGAGEWRCGTVCSTARHGTAWHSTNARQCWSLAKGGLGLAGCVHTRTCVSHTYWPLPPHPPDSHSSPHTPSACLPRPPKLTYPRTPPQTNAPRSW